MEYTRYQGTLNRFRRTCHGGNPEESWETVMRDLIDDIESWPYFRSSSPFFGNGKLNKLNPHFYLKKNHWHMPSICIIG